MVWGMLGLNDRVKVTKRGAKGKGKVVEMPMGTNNVVVEYDNGDRVTVQMGDTTKIRK